MAVDGRARGSRGVDRNLVQCVSDCGKARKEIPKKVGSVGGGGAKNPRGYPRTKQRHMISRGLARKKVWE